MRTILLAAASAAGLLVGMANAATFHMSHNVANTHFVGSLTDDHGELINIYAAAAIEKNDEFSLVNGLKYFSGYGLGIQRKREGGVPNHAIDGLGPDEAVVFQAQKASDNSLVAVDWKSIVFGWEYGRSSDFTLWTGDAGLGSLSLELKDQDIFVGADQSLGVAAATIAIQADYWDDAFKIAKLTVDAIAKDGDPVPIPGALPLMLAGIAGLGALRRRNSR